VISSETRNDVLRNTDWETLT